MPGPIVVSGDDAAEGVLLPLYRRATGRKIGRFVVYTTTGEATDGEANRQVIIDRATDDEMPLDALAGTHLYVATGDEAEHQTRVLSVGTHGADSILRMARVTTNVVGEGIEIELSGSAPSVSYGMWPCLNDAVNDALASLPIIKDHGFEFVSGQVRYGLEALTWRGFRSSDVLDVYLPIPSGSTAAATTPRSISRSAWNVEYDGELPYLLLNGWGGTEGETFFVRMRRPANTWIRSSAGVWGNSTTGLTSDDQAAVYDVETVVNVAAPKACEKLEHYWRDQGDDARADTWAMKRERLGMAAGAARFFRGFRTNGRQRVNAVGGR